MGERGDAIVREPELEADEFARHHLMHSKDLTYAQNTNSTHMAIRATDSLNALESLNPTRAAEMVDAAFDEAYAEAQLEE